MTADHADRAVDAWCRVMSKLARAQPRSTFERREDGVLLIITGISVSNVNGVFSTAREADARIIAATAHAAASAGVPWSIQVRGDSPSAEIVTIAGCHGLNGRKALPFMLKALDSSIAAVAEDGLAQVRPVSPEESSTYVGVLANGFGGPKELFQSFGSPAVLGTAGFTGYLVEVDGVPVASGLTAVEGDWVGIFNIATLPAARRRGYGRAVMSKLLRDAYAAGARHAFLHSSSDGLELYKGMGFRVAESWTVFS